MKSSDMKASINVNPALEIRHATIRGTGALLRMRLIVDGTPEFRGVLIGIAPQMTCGEPLAKSSYDHGVMQVAMCGFVEVAQLLQVLRGELEDTRFTQVFDDGKVVVTFKHILEPVFGYKLTIGDGDFFMTPAEALGICEALACAFKEIAFGK